MSYFSYSGKSLLFFVGTISMKPFETFYIVEPQITGLQFKRQTRFTGQDPADCSLVFKLWNWIKVRTDPLNIPLVGAFAILLSFLRSRAFTNMI